MTESSGSPVFVSGLSRSGKTLLLCLLDGHPDLLVFPEEGRLFVKIVPNFQAGGLEAAVDFIMGRFRNQIGQPRHIHLTESDLAEYEDRLRGRFARSDGSAKAMVEAVILAYGDITGQHGKRLWLEGTSGNGAFADRIAEWFPDARMIHLVRDPRTTLAESRELRPRAVHGFAKRWKRALRNIASASARLPTMIVRYEDLVTDPESTLQRVTSFLGVRWDDCLLQPTKNGKLWGGSPTDEVSSRELDRRDRNLPETDQRIIGYFLSKQMADLGYGPARPAGPLLSADLFLRHTARDWIVARMPGPLKRQLGKAYRRLRVERSGGTDARGGQVPL